ncbi:unnamed protein product [Schistocephalus solidus]|uniref:Uncharacterized protein n=1 Tax=Schistocephalus solidus TaxID=70667 RepID=A0A183SD93_SCHSO|nr:unnamed protein product [Schistocephalus solidus]
MIRPRKWEVARRKHAVLMGAVACQKSAVPTEVAFTGLLSSGRTAQKQGSRVQLPHHGNQNEDAIVAGQTSAVLTSSPTLDGFNHQSQLTSSEPVRLPASAGIKPSCAF